MEKDKCESCKKLGKVGSGCVDCLLHHYSKYEPIKPDRSQSFNAFHPPERIELKESYYNQAVINCKRAVDKLHEGRLF